MISQCEYHGGHSKQEMDAESQSSLETGNLVTEAEVVEVVSVQTVLAGTAVIHVTVQASHKLVTVELEFEELGKGEEERVVSHLDIRSALCVYCVCERGRERLLSNRERNCDCEGNYSLSQGRNKQKNKLRR